MAAEHPTTSWQAMQDGSVFYRQQRLYTLDGKFPSLGDCIVAGCRNGGPLGACSHIDLAITKRPKGGPTALMRDTKKMIAIGPATPIFAKSQIQVYSPSGEGLLLLSVRVDCSVDLCARFSRSHLVGTSQNYSLRVGRRRETSDPKRGGRIPSLRSTRRLCPILSRHRCRRGWNHGRAHTR